MRYSEISYVYNTAICSTELKNRQLTPKQLDNLSIYNYTAVKSKRGNRLLLIFTEKHYLYNVSVVMRPFLSSSKSYELVKVVRDFIKVEGLQGNLSL